MQGLSSSSSSSSGSSSSYGAAAAALSVSPSPLSPTTALSPTSALSSSRLAKKRVLAISEDPTEALVEHVKKCRVSSTPGELRLKKDLVDCDLLHQQGVARFDKTPGNPLKCQLTFLCPIGGVGVPTPAAEAGAARGMRRVPTTFSIIVPKFYPHDPPTIFAERCFRRSCSFVGEDGQLHLPFLGRAAWSSVSTMAFVVETLLQGLRKYAAGEPQPWRIASQAAELNAAEPRLQHPEEDHYAPALSAAAVAAAVAAAAAAAAAGAGAGASFASSGDLLRSPMAPEGVRRDGGGDRDEWAVETRWNTMQPSGGGGGGGSGGDGGGSGSGSGGGCGNGSRLLVLNTTPSIFGGQPCGDCGGGGGEGGGGGGGGLGSLGGTPAVFGQEEAVVGSGGAGASAVGLDPCAKLGGWTLNISDGCMDVTDSL